MQEFLLSFGERLWRDIEWISPSIVAIFVVYLTNKYNEKIKKIEVRTQINAEHRKELLNLTYSAIISFEVNTFYAPYVNDKMDEKSIEELSDVKDDVVNNILKIMVCIDDEVTKRDLQEIISRISLQYNKLLKMANTKYDAEKSCLFSEWADMIKETQGLFTKIMQIYLKKTQKTEFELLQVSNHKTHRN